MLIKDAVTHECCAMARLSQQIDPFWLLPMLAPALTANDKCVGDGFGIEGCALYTVRYAMRELKPLVQDIGWRIIDRQESEQLVASSAFWPTLNDAVLGSQHIIQRAMSGMALTLEANRDLVVSSDPTDTKGIVVAPVTALALHEMFLRHLCDRSPWIRDRQRRYGSFGSVWIGIESEHRLRIMQTPRTVRYRSGGYSIEVPPLLVSDSTDWLTGATKLVWDDTFFMHSLKTAYH